MNPLFQGLRLKLAMLFDYEALSSTALPYLGNLLLALLVFGAFFLFWRVLYRTLRTAVIRERLDATTASFIETALQFTVLTVGVVEALSMLGIDTGAVLTSLGIAGLSIGFAARDALANMISGVLIFWDRPFVIGDLVEVEGHYGRVDRITLRSTRVVTVDGRMLAVPNSTIINSTVASYTNFPSLRLDIDVSIGVREDIANARKILLSLVQDDQRYLSDPAPCVVITALNDYNIALQLQTWLRDEKVHITERFALRERVFEALRTAGVEMPFETLQILPVTAVATSRREHRVQSIANTAGDPRR